MSTALIEPHYLPSLEYFAAISQCEKVVLEVSEHFVKQTYRNRCVINTSQGPLTLVVPLAVKGNRIPFRDVRIDDRSRWRTIHWRAIVSSYAKAPFFEHYRDDLGKLIGQSGPFLLDLDLALLSFCLKSLGNKIELSETTSYEKTAGPGILDLRSAIIAKRPYSDPPRRPIRPYRQVFGNEFVPNLSIVDLLACEGPRAPAFLRSSDK